LEKGLRLIYPDKVNESFQPYEFDVPYLRALKHNIWETFRRSQANGGDIIRWRANKHGFRGDDLQAAPDVRIIVYGDSNIQARFSHLENTFPYKLQGYLKGLTGKQIEVINAGLIGFGPDQSLIRFSLEAEIYKPDIVIFHIFADNDFVDLIKNRLFTLDQRSNAINANYMVERAQISLWSWDEVRETLSSLMITRAAVRIWKEIAGLTGQKDSGHFKPRAELTMEEQFERLISASEKDWTMYKEGNSSGGDHYDIDIALFPRNESSKTKMALMSHVLKNAKMLADARNIRFMVMIQPSSRDLTTNLALNYKHFLQYSGYKRTNLAFAVDSICRDNKIHKINLFDLFLRSKPETLYFSGRDNHWNDAGQELAAQEVAQYIYEKLLD